MKEHQPTKPDPRYFTGVAADMHAQGIYNPSTHAQTGDHLTRFDRGVLRGAGLQTIDTSRPVYGPGSEIRRPHRPNRVGVAVVGGLTGLAAVNAGHLAWEAAQSEPNPVKVIEYSDKTTDLPEPEDAVIHITQPNEVAEVIAQKYTPEGESSHKLADQIHDAAKDGEDPGLDPGDRVIIPQ